MHTKKSRLVQAAASAALGISLFTITSVPAMAAGSLIQKSASHPWADKQWDDVSLIYADKGWNKSLYATDIMIINNTGQRLILKDSKLDWGEWHAAPPAFIEPGQLVHVASNGSSVFSGTEADVTYTSADKSIAFDLYYDNPVGKNKYRVTSGGDTRIAARDYRNQAWVPRENSTDSITSSDFGDNNWTSEAFEIGTQQNLPGKDLPAAKYSGSKDKCNDYLSLMKGAKPGHGQNLEAYWQSGAAGQLAGAVLGAVIFC